MKVCDKQCRPLKAIWNLAPSKLWDNAAKQVQFIDREVTVRSRLMTLLTISVLLGMSSTLPSQDASLGFSDTPFQPDGKWHIHDGTRPQPDSESVDSIVAMPAPSDAHCAIQRQQRSEQMADGTRRAG